MLPVGSPVGAAEWAEVYVPLAHVIGIHIDGWREVARRLDAAGLHGAGAGAFVIGLAGSVAAGKSTCATTLAALLRGLGLRVEVVSTDGFLLPNAVLSERGSIMRKGFPDSYDASLMASVLGGLAAGSWPVEVPRYSHDVYDITGPPQILSEQDVVIVEGVNALGRVGTVDLADACHLRVYLDAEEASLRRWYVARFRRLVDEARVDGASFFAQWVGLGDAEVAQLAEGVWEGVNLVNLDDHILPTRWRADVVLHKDGDHAVEGLSIRAR